MQFRVKTIIVEAFQLRKEGPTPTPTWFFDKAILTNDWPTTFEIPRPKGIVIAKLGDWIVLMPSGELEVYTEEQFYNLYEYND